MLFVSTSAAYLWLPGWRTQGYACHWNGEPIIYKLNGPVVLAAVVGVWSVLACTGSEMSWLTAEYFGVSCVVANVLGVVASFMMFLASQPESAHRCLTVDQTTLREQAATGNVMSLVPRSPDRSAGGHFFYGRSFNPQLWGCDVKMGLYVVGAAVLEWNVLSAARLHVRLEGSLSLPLVTYVSLLSWFVCEYLMLEVVHLYTYDIMCEKLGFKLIWGCFAFYPFFYCVGVWPLVSSSGGSNASCLTVVGCVVSVLVFFAGWSLTRGANLQKFFYKTRPASSLLNRGLLTNETVPNTRLLCSGFWGLARHINYLGEIVQAVALAIPGTLAPWSLTSLLPWFYPLYYVALFVPRQKDDDEQLRLKYGDSAFEAYVQRVPYRMVPCIW